LHSLGKHKAKQVKKIQVKKIQVLLQPGAAKFATPQVALMLFANLIFVPVCQGLTLIKACLALLRFAAALCKIH